MAGMAGRELGSVVVGTNFSDGARAALERAIRLPLGPGATVEILHALPDERDRGVAEQMDAAAHERLGQARRSFKDAFAAKGVGKPDVFISARHGHPDIEIARHAHRGRAELIVLGRHGHTTVRDLLVGSTAERVVRRGDVSVLVVGKAPAGPYRRPLVAVDLSESARLAIEMALRLCEGTADSIAIVHALPLLDTVDLPVPGYRIAEDVRRARAALSDLLRDFESRPVRFDIVIHAGDPRTIILQEARHRGADLIALGTHGRSGVARAVMGSVAERVLRAATCDVLVARLHRADVTL